MYAAKRMHATAASVYQVVGISKIKADVTIRTILQNNQSNNLSFTPSPSLLQGSPCEDRR
jgi:hypothetical protein